MNYLIASAISLSLISCGKSDWTVDANLVPYFEMFQNNIGVSTEGISGHFTGLTRPIIGQCFVDDKGNRDVQIDADYWKSATDSDREVLVFHELGHCAMNLGHNNNFNKNGCPISIMFPEELPEWCFELYRTNYYEEMESHK